MPSQTKDWLVRTRNREVLGPFTQSELYRALKDSVFSADDEIAPSAGSWIGAQTLLNRDPDEVTRTSARNQTSSINVGEHTPHPLPLFPPQKISRPPVPIPSRKILVAKWIPLPSLYRPGRTRRE